jgi:hypothetical protein
MPDIRTTLINSNPQEISEEDWFNICDELFELIIKLSPVDTGNFRDAWELNQVAGDIFEIYNSTEYASFLEDGWSVQAPNGVVEVALQKLPGIIRKYIKRKPKGEVYVTVEIPDYVPAQ